MDNIVHLQSKDVTYTISSLSEAITTALNLIPVAQISKLQGKVLMLCYEEFYFRNNSETALTVLITEDDNGQQDINLVGFAGGGGLFNLAWGSDGDIVKRLTKFLQKVGYVVIEE